MPGQELALRYAPRPHFTDLHNRDVRWACLVVHRRGGKTVACIGEGLTRASYTSKENARYAYIAPFYRQAKDVAWQYLKDMGKDFIVKVRESELRVELFNGAWITLYGADNPDALRGLYLDGVILDEYGDCRPSLWGTVVLPTLADRKGWAIFIGTPKGKNHFYDVHRRAQLEDNWYSLKLPASQSGILDEEELSEMRAQMSEEQYNQEMECDFEAAVLGTYYANDIQMLERQQMITPDTRWDPGAKVSVAFDLGFSDSTAMWFWQKTHSGYNVLRYYEAQGKKIPHYTQYLESTGYEYDEIWLPHDAKADTLATQRTSAEQFQDWAEAYDEDIHLGIVPKLAVQHGIDAVRLILPQCHFNQVLCYEGIEALRAYRRTFDEIKKVFSDKPLHDWASDGADAFRMMALVCSPTAMAKAQPEGPRPLLTPPRYQLEPLFEEREGNITRSFQKLRM